MVESRVGQQGQLYLTRRGKAGRAVFCFFAASLLILTAASFLVCIGIVKNPPPRSLPALDPSKYEIVTEGHTIYARPKPGPATGTTSGIP
jgi:hypothetical protein